MILRLTKITETLLEGKPAFVSEFGLDLSVETNKTYKAAVLQLVTSERLKDVRIGQGFVFRLKQDKSKLSPEEKEN